MQYESCRVVRLVDVFSVSFPPTWCKISIRNVTGAVVVKQDCIAVFVVVWRNNGIAIVVTVVLGVTAALGVTTAICAHTLLPQESSSLVQGWEGV